MKKKKKEQAPLVVVEKTWSEKVEALIQEKRSQYESAKEDLQYQVEELDEKMERLDEIQSDLLE